MNVKCCERDTDGDGNCDVHQAPGVLRVGKPPFKIKTDNKSIEPEENKSGPVKSLLPDWKKRGKP